MIDKPRELENTQSYMKQGSEFGDLAIKDPKLDSFFETNSGSGPNSMSTEPIVGPTDIVTEQPSNFGANSTGNQSMMKPGH